MGTQPDRSHINGEETALEYIHCRSFTGADFDTYHYLVVAEVREGLPVTKQATEKFDMKRFNLRKPNDLEVKKQYKIEISNRFAALENLNDMKDIIGFGKT
jgi:hypothetical protein